MRTLRAGQQYSTLPHQSSGLTSPGLGRARLSRKRNTPLLTKKRGGGFFHSQIWRINIMAKELDKAPTLIAVTKALLIPHEVLIDGVKYNLNPSGLVPKFWADEALKDKEHFYVPSPGADIDSSDHPKKDILAGKGIEQIFKLLPEE